MTANDSMPVQFVGELPPPKPRVHKWDATADALRAKPQEWALIAENAATSMVGNIQNGVLVSFRPAGAFEAVHRNQKLGYGEIYARYVGVSG